MIMDVAKMGIGSKIQKSAANANNAITRCSTTERLSKGSQVGGTISSIKGISMQLMSL